MPSTYVCIDAIDSILVYVAVSKSMVGVLAAASAAKVEMFAPTDY